MGVLSFSMAECWNELWTSNDALLRGIALRDCTCAGPSHLEAETNLRQLNRMGPVSILVKNFVVGTLRHEIRLDHHLTLCARL